jgi:hypothetical protein
MFLNRRESLHSECIKLCIAVRGEHSAMGRKRRRFSLKIIRWDWAIGGHYGCNLHRILKSLHLEMVSCK